MAFPDTTFVSKQTVISQAWAQAVNNRLVTCVNAKDPGFAATGNGVTEDTTALQAAITAAEVLSIAGVATGRPEVVLPAGIYLTGTLTTSKRIKLRGDGSGSTFLKLKSGVTTSLLVINAENVGSTSVDDTNHVIVEGMTLEGNRTGTATLGASHGIYCPAPAWNLATQYSPSIQATDVHILNFTGDGIYLGDNRNWALLDRCIVRYVNGNALSSYGYDHRIVSCDFGLATRYNVRLYAGGAVKFTGCNFYYANPANDAVSGTEGYNVLIDPYVNAYVEFNGCDNDYAHKNGLYINGATASVKWIGGRFYGNSRAGANTYSDIVTSSALQVVAADFTYAVQASKYLIEISGAPQIDWIANNYARTGTLPYGTAVSNKPALLQSSESMVMNAMQYGITGDGSTDDAAAINSLLVLARGTGKTVYFPYATYLCGSQIVATQVRIVTDNASFRFSGLSGTTDCLRLESSTSAFPLSIENLIVNANSTGRDAVLVTGGGSFANTNDHMRIDGMLIQGAVRDGLHMEQDGNSRWIEDFRLSDVDIRSPGRHGIAMIVGNYTASFINQGVFNNCEVRGAGQTTAGSYDVYVDLQGTSAGQKANEHLFNSCEFDVTGAANHAQGSIGFARTGSAGEISGWTFVGCTFEDTGSRITGFPFICVIASGTPTVGGITKLGGATAKYNTLIDPAVASRITSLGDISGSRDQIAGLGNYANDAAAAAGGLQLGCLYRNGSVLMTRVV